MKLFVVTLAIKSIFKLQFSKGQYKVNFKYPNSLPMMRANRSRNIANEKFSKCYQSINIDHCSELLPDFDLGKMDIGLAHYKLFTITK